jgi:K+-transporting ATPase KdpF subunit
MTIFYIIGLIVAAGLVVYLFASLLKPELFLHLNMVLDALR